MSRARGKQTLQIGLPEGALDDLETIAPMVGKSIGQRGLTANMLSAWATQYWLTLDQKQKIKAIQVGIDRERKYLNSNPGIPVSIGQGDEPGSGPVMIGGATKGVTGIPLPARIDGRTKRRSDQHAAMVKMSD